MAYNIKGDVHIGRQVRSLEQRLDGATSGNIIITAPDTVTSYALTWPPNAGSNGQFMMTDGMGNTSWDTFSIEDYSFAIQGVVGNNASIKGGQLRTTLGDTLVTGSGTTSTTTQVDLSINLTTVLGSSPVSDTTYYLYVDRQMLGPSINLTDNGRKVFRVYDPTHFHLDTNPPDMMNSVRYFEVGFVHSDDSGGWDGVNSHHGASALRLHDLNSNLFILPEKYTKIVTSETVTTEAHNLTGQPQFIQFFYFDGTEKLSVDGSNCLLDVTDTIISFSSYGYAFGGGKYIEVEALYLNDDTKQIVSVANRYESPWFTDNLTTQVEHNLSDSLDIKGFSVIEWDVTAGTSSILNNASALVYSYDDTYLYLDWTGFSPSSTLQYKIVTGGQALAQSYPYYLGGYTKLVGFGPGSYISIAAALAVSVPGDSILINKSQTISSAITISVSNVSLTFMPGITVTVTGGTKGLVLSGNYVEVNRPHIVGNFNGNMSSGIEISGDCCFVDKATVETNHASVSIADAYKITATGDRNYINGNSLATLGTITNPVTDLGTNNTKVIRG